MFTRRSINPKCISAKCIQLYLQQLLETNANIFLSCHFFSKDKKTNKWKKFRKDVYVNTNEHTDRHTYIHIYTHTKANFRHYEIQPFVICSHSTSVGFLFFQEKYTTHSGCVSTTPTISTESLFLDLCSIRVTFSSFQSTNECSKTSSCGSILQYMSTLPQSLFPSIV